MNELEHLVAAIGVWAQTEVELGCGTGALLEDLAKWHPDRHYIGVELQEPRARAAARRVRRKRIGNVTIVHGEARTFLEGLAPASVDVLHLYHPTPYPKSLGLPHRLIDQDFERLAHGVLRPWGKLRLITDHRGYYYDALLSFASRRWWSIDWQRHPVAVIRNALVGSPLEMEYRAAGVTEFFASVLIRLP